MDVKKNGNEDVVLGEDGVFKKKYKENLLRKKIKYRLNFMLRKIKRFFLCAEKGKCLNAFSRI